jgi:hypothetical protein
MGAMILHWAALCALGAIVHIGCQALLWHQCGRPVGPEFHLFERLRDKLAALLTRVAG